MSPQIPPNTGSASNHRFRWWYSTLQQAQPVTGHQRSHTDSTCATNRFLPPPSALEERPKDRRLCVFTSTGHISRSGPAGRRVLFLMSLMCCFPNRLHNSQFKQQCLIFCHFHVSHALSLLTHTAGSLRDLVTTARPTRPRRETLPLPRGGQKQRGLPRPERGSTTLKSTSVLEEKLQHYHLVNT